MCESRFKYERSVRDDARTSLALRRRSWSRVAAWVGPKLGPRFFKCCKLFGKQHFSRPPQLALGAGGVAGSLKTGQPPAVHTQLPSGSLAKICKAFRNTRPRSAVDAKTGESRPDSGCDVLSLAPPVTPEAAGSAFACRSRISTILQRI
jgi:hypothetical protein